MQGNSSGKVYYVCFYAEDAVKDKIVTYPSVISKIDYVKNVIKDLGKEVVILSIAPARNGRFRGFTRKVDDKETHVYLPSYMPANKIGKKLLLAKHFGAILRYLKKHVQENDKVIVYHSLFNRFWFPKFYQKHQNACILEIEDVFSALSENAKKYEDFEWKLFRSMKKCLCVNDIIYRELPQVPEKTVSYGSYSLLPEFEKEDHQSVRLVYAGVIEQERNAAFLAVKAMEHLPQNYELHILGFGTDENIRALEEWIEKINRQCNRTAAKYHGSKTGEDYWRFLQNCDIALSTHAYDADSIRHADYTFPSKILTYLANGLPVVAQRLEVLEGCAVAEHIQFYEEPTPAAIAQAIQSVNCADSKDPLRSIKKLDLDFRNAIKTMLEE